MDSSTELNCIIILRTDNLRLLNIAKTKGRKNLSSHLAACPHRRSQCRSTISKVSCLWRTLLVQNFPHCMRTSKIDVEETRSWGESSVLDFGPSMGFNDPMECQIFHTTCNNYNMKRWNALRRKRCGYHVRSGSSHISLSPHFTTTSEDSPSIYCQH